MKQLLEMLPKILGMMPEIVKYIKYIPILMILAGIGYGIYYAAQNYKDPDRKSTRLNSSHVSESRMPSSA